MQATRDSRPIHRVYVDGFWMDKTEVTNEQFTAFVKATGYMTAAERTPRAEDFPIVLTTIHSWLRRAALFGIQKVRTRRSTPRSLA